MCLAAYFLVTGCRKADNKKEAHGGDQEEQMPLVQKSENEQTEEESKVNPFLFAIPAAFDFIGSSLMSVGLTMCAASIYQMMRGLIVVITAAMAMIFLGRKQYLHHYMSLFMIVAAVFIVGFSGIKG